jgi:uncharacterized membrane-anchored protein
MSRRFGVLFLTLFFLQLSPNLGVALADDHLQDSSRPEIVWNKGPYKAKLGSVAEIDIPKGYAFTDAAGTKRFMELTHNPSSDQDIGLVLPLRPDPGPGAKVPDWYLLFEFNGMGYVSDSEKSSLDANKILESLKKSTEQENAYRQKQGWAAYHVTGWERPPFYDERTHDLVWATLGESDDPKEGQSVNYSTRILGRNGTMNVDLVLEPADLDAVLPLSNQLMSGFGFTPGSRYADFVKGDKVASYGLTALIAGGAAAAAIKTGLFAKLIAAMVAFWKFMVVGFAAAASAVKKFFAKLRRKISGEEEAAAVTVPAQGPPSQHAISSDHDPH